MLYDMKTERSSGILLHPTSLPGTPGIGTLGAKAYSFVDWLSKAHQSLWQILPLGPTGYGDSPYASFSTFAGNPLLIDLDNLVQRGWAKNEDIIPPEYIKTTGNVDFGSVVWWKTPTLKTCAEYFLENASEEDSLAFKNFVKINKSWLDSYASFMSIKSFYDKKAQDEKVSGIKAVWFNFWPKKLALHDADEISKWNKEHKTDIEIIKVIQFFFFTQWKALKDYANSKQIKIIGDIPIFVAADSSDVWSNQQFFQLSKKSIPEKVAGVPPDYFSATGQLWGNPLYNWDALKDAKYSWWISRIRHILTLVDFVRIDHFRGFEAYWAIPFGEETAINGKWVQGPGSDLFKAIKKSLGDIPIIAEDLGVITDGVRALRDDFNLPGMKVLQFAFSTDEARQNGMVNCFLPHNYIQNCIVYTGTHDNDTTQGWLSSLNDEQITLVTEYAYSKRMPINETKSLLASGELCRKIIFLSLASSANMAVTPLQDIFALDTNSRMNEPSTVGKNWTWRMADNLLNDGSASDLAFITDMYGR